MKFVRNLALTNSLTTFHSIFVKTEYVKYTDLIFCYFLTPIAQAIMRDNRKELGNKLEKYQPNDLNEAMMLNIDVISSEDKSKIDVIYHKMVANYSDSFVKELNDIFSTYLLL